MAVDAKLMTADELLALPRGQARYELVNGELITMSPAGAKHGEIAMIIGAHLHAYVKQHRLGKVYAAETGFQITTGPDSVLAPDVAFVRAERVVEVSKYFPGPPDLAVEVRSPGDRPGKVETKTRRWLESGVPRVIVVDQARRTATTHTPASVTSVDIEGALEGADVVPGWNLPLREIFE